MNLEQINELTAQDMADVNATILDQLNSDVSLINQLGYYIISGGGKRIRPMIAVLAARAINNYDGKQHITVAALIEFIHTATLLHDDVVDESDMRRGKATANAAFGNAASVLVGDYLFSRSFQLMVETGSLRVLDILANASATIAEGEVLQLTAAADLATTEEIYFKVVRGKTAALFSAAMQVGGVIADADEDKVKALFAYGDALGISFQIFDDLLDYGGTDAIGKNVGDDFRERKLTLPVIRAIAAGDADERTFWKRTIGKGQQDDGDLDRAMSILARHGAMRSTRDTALEWAEKAKAALAPIPDHDLKSMLIDLADYVVARIT